MTERRTSKKAVVAASEGQQGAPEEATAAQGAQTALSDGVIAGQARADWMARMGRRAGDAIEDTGLPRLPAPSGVRARPGRGQVTLDWEYVEGAVGYLVHRAGSREGPFDPLDHLGRDVLAVPHPPYADTTCRAWEHWWYAVAAIADVRTVGELSDPVAAAPLAAAQAGSSSADERLGPGNKEQGALPRNEIYQKAPLYGASEARPRPQTGQVAIQVDAGEIFGPLHRPWRPMIGSEHLSHLLCEDTTGGRPIGAELAEALRIVASELGVQTVRAHAILSDDLGVYREVDGVPAYDFTSVDMVYDRVLSLGLRPIVELSFMPRDLAADPSATVFTYDAIISPPKDWDRWEDLVRAFVSHLADRYGLAEVRDHWAFEVWNEANLEVFWSGTPEEYLRLYDVTARAVKSIDRALVVGGPASAAAGWIDELLAYAAEPTTSVRRHPAEPARCGGGTAAVDGDDRPGSSAQAKQAVETDREDVRAPIDFVSTHTYGSPPLDLRPLLRRHGRSGTPVWWTEWGVTPQHFNTVGESVFAAAFLARGMRSAAGRVGALSYWVASDHFEELGRPERLLHGGFGLLTVGNLRKPRFYALALLERLGEREVSVSLSGDGAASLVEAWAARDDDGRITVAVWNGTLDQSKTAGEALLDRWVTVDLTGLDAQAYTMRHYRVDVSHSNIAAVWERMRGGAAWPDEDGWRALHEADHLAELHAPLELQPVGGRRTFEFDLPMPAVSLLELVPVGVAEVHPG